MNKKLYHTLMGVMGVIYIIFGVFVGITQHFINYPLSKRGSILLMILFIIYGLIRVARAIVNLKKINK